MDKKLFAILKNFGLTNYEAEVYSALLKVDKAKVSDLAEMVSVPRPQIYLILKRLIDLGLCTEKKGKIKYYSCLPPNIGLRYLLEKEEKELKNKFSLIKELEKIYKQRENKKKSLEFIEVIKGESGREYLISLLKNAKKEVLIFCKYILKKTKERLEKSYNMEMVALKNNVKVYCLYEKSFFNDPDIFPYIKKLIKNGEKARVIDYLPMNMTVIDEKSATFSLLGEDEEDVVIFYLNHPALITLMKAGFEYYWQKGKEVNLKKEEK
ncbi:MAG: helix-turn-helix domain-containing protein [candidate division WOR-3 bacterium]